MLFDYNRTKVEIENRISSCLRLLRLLQQNITD